MFGPTCRTTSWIFDEDRATLGKGCRVAILNSAGHCLGHERNLLSFTYDKWGYRNPVNLHHADVALIGDSFVEGW